MRVLAGDIGGTKTLLRIAAVERGAQRVVAEQRFESGAFDGLSAVLRALVSSVGRDALAGVNAACFGIAGPVQRRDAGQFAKVTNLPWEVDSAALAREFDIPKVRLINDFQAIGYGIEALGPQDLVTLQQGRPEPHGPCAVIGAGTGLGQGILVWQGDHYEALPTEGGHADFGPTDELQVELWRSLKREFGRVGYERLLSGPGLARIYMFLRDRAPARESPELAKAMQSGDPAAAVSEAALTQGGSLAGEALDLFVRIYGTQAGNLALTVLATGGVYIAGGIAPKIIAKLKDGAFLRALNDKGRMSPLVQATPVHVIVNPKVGLIGAALAAARM